jgi:hypothetical protein
MLGIDDAVVAFLVAWAAGKARRVGKRINGLTDQALDTAVDRVWQVVMAKLGSDPTIQRLMAEARETGDASSETRAAAAATLQRTAQQDQRFAADLRDALPADAHASSGPGSGDSWTIGTGDIKSLGSVNIGNKVTNYVKRNPLITLFSVAVAVVALWLFATAINSLTGNDHSDGGNGATAMAGTWTASDGTGTKTFNGNGPCTGFYYNNGVPLDIGGPMTCTISSKPDAQGFYTLTVTQSPNESSYKLHFDSSDRATVYSSSDRKLYELQRA